MKSVYSLFFNPGEVVEVRALGLRGKNSAWEGFAGGKGGIVHGYFDDADKLANAAAALDKAGARGVYFMINPCIPPLLARAANRLICPQDEAATPDMYIAKLRWFLVDLDSKLLDGSRRPKGVSASNEELKICQARAEEVAKFLEGEHGFAKAIRAFSGNGYHLNYRLPDLPNDDDHKALIKNAMAVLADKFGTLDIDVSVVNPARIWKFYGTTGRKGDSTPERQHRKSYVFPNQPTVLADIPCTDLETLKKFTALAQTPAPSVPKSPAGTAASGSSAPPSPNTTRPMTTTDLGPIDMEKYLQHYNISYSVKERNDKKLGAATFYILDHCVFNPDHSGGEAAIVVPRAGAIKYQCFHASCKSNTWKDARRHISGDKNLAEFCTGFDPNWQPPRQTGTGMMSELPIPMTAGAALMNGIHSKIKVPRPTEVDPLEFYTKKGRRPVFVPWDLALYISHYLDPIIHTNGKFYHYENGFWKEFTHSSIAQICVHSMKREIQASWIDNTIKIMSGMLNREEAEWPQYLNLINCKNGMLDIATGELLEHDMKYGSRQQLPVNYNQEDEESERWMKFLDEIFPDDKSHAKRWLLQQFFGYCFLRDSRYQKALFLYGTGANGKSTVLDVLTAMVGAENTSSLTLQDLSKQFRAQFLQNKLINVSTETDTRDPLTTSTFKAVVDGSPLTTERKYGEPFQYRPYAKWIVAMNEAPVIPDKSYGFGRRVLVLNFNHRFEPEEIKERMAEYLIEDIDRIFKWSVTGLKVLLEHKGFVIGKQVEEDTDKLMEVLNPLLIFVSECCEIDDSKERKLYEHTKRLWLSYSEWCREGKNRPLGRNKFFEQLLASFTRLKKKRLEEEESMPTVFTGICLNEPGREYAEKGKIRSEKIYEDKY